MKNDIFRRYKETGKLTNEDWEFCEHTDWHPVDEMPLKEEHIEKLKMTLKEPSTRYQSTEEFFESIK